MNGKTQTQKRIIQKSQQLRKAVRRAQASRRQSGRQPDTQQSSGGSGGTTPKPKGGEGSGGLARLGTGPVKGSRPTRSRTSSGSSGSSVKTILMERPTDPPGRPSLAVRKHATMASFKKAISRNHETSHHGLATASEMHGTGLDEIDFMRNGVVHTRVSGRELLGAVGFDFDNISVSDIVLSIGERLGMYPISPTYLGGRLELLAQEYEQHSVNHLKLVYVPSVPATTPGALAFYFTNDIGTPTFYVGESELGHAATHTDFIQSTVWNETHLDITPSDAINKYFDEDHSESRLSIQGMITALAASDIALGSSSTETLGNLYLEYDLDFFAPALAYDVPLRSSAVVTLSTVSVGTPWQSGDPIIFRSAAVADECLAFACSSYPPGATGLGDLVGWVFYGVSVNIQAVAPGLALFRTSDSLTAHTFAYGQGFWFDFAAVQSQFRGMVFGDLNSMSEVSESDLATEDGALRWANTPGASSGALEWQLQGYWVKKNEDG